MTPKEIRRARLYIDVSLNDFGKIFGVSGKMAWRWERPINTPNHSPMKSEYEKKLICLLKKQNKQTKNE